MRDKLNFSKLLQRTDQVIDEEKWQLYAVERVFYETDDFDKAQMKLKVAENTSDLLTEAEETEEIRPKRKIIKRRHYSSDDSGESGDSEPPLSKLPRPPRIKQATGISEQLDVDTRNESQVENTVSCCSSPPKASTPDVTLEGHSLKVQTPSLISDSFGKTLHDNNGTFQLHKGQLGERAPSYTLKSNTAFTILLSNLLKVKEQNRKILDILQKHDLPRNSILPEDVPVKLPLERLEDVSILETYLEIEENFNKFKSYCASISSSKDLIQKNNRILRSILSDTVAKHYNYFGNNRHQKALNKRPFHKLEINKIVIDAVKHDLNFSTEEIENAIKSWLKHAPSRSKKNNN